ncbi:hypothetical protein ACH492_06720 [Streptomyces sp. NPDC019443]|uniref:hypothetical protein n=1 Tax=Streptomyces sp. NPDC019443 TaxID=3365061 RepID=UPI003798EE9D
MSSVARQVAEMLTGRRVRDVLVPGWIDRDDDLPEFRPQPLVLWLRLDQGLIRLASEGQFGHLAARPVTAAGWTDVDLLAEAEDEVVLASCGEQLFGDGRDQLTCTELRGYGGDAGTTIGLALDFEGGHTLFLDPAWTFGIRMGNRADEARWVEEYGSDTVRETLVPGAPNGA